MNLELTEVEYNICLMAVRKCNFLWRCVKADVQMVPLTKKNFGFPDLTNEELDNLTEKLYKNSELAWLRDQPKEQDQG
jgi:phage terminase Nu1 subunit (DNA packaging protein)